MGSFFLPPSGLLVFSSCRGAKLQRIAEATIPFPLQDSCLRRRRIWRRGVLLSKSRKESQSDHFIFLATKMPLFDSQVPGLPPTTHGSRILLPRSKRRGSQGSGTQEKCRAYHLQTNIEPWSEGVEPRKKKPPRDHNSTLNPLSYFKFVYNLHEMKRKLLFQK